MPFIGLCSGHDVMNGFFEGFIILKSCFLKVKTKLSADSLFLKVANSLGYSSHKRPSP
jgi:hypothetical protein